MHIPSPLFDHNWGQPQAPGIEEAPLQSGTSARRIAWEIGVVLLVPLVGSVIIEMLLKAFHIT
jgi:hypothetical protein